jgi:hypothetical protein
MYQSIQQRNRIIDRLIAQERRLKRQGKQDTRECREVREAISRLQYDWRRRVA